jgi:hypothetical protein
MIGNLVGPMKATAARVKLLEDFTMAGLQAQIDAFLLTLGEATFLSIQYQLAGGVPPYEYETDGTTTAELDGGGAWTGNSTVNETTAPIAYTAEELSDLMPRRYSVLILFTE